MRAIPRCQTCKHAKEGPVYLMCTDPSHTCTVAVDRWARCERWDWREGPIERIDFGEPRMNPRDAAVSQLRHILREHNQVSGEVEKLEVERFVDMMVDVVKDALERE